MDKRETGYYGKSFDENGHRINRNPKTTHRNKMKVNQSNPNVFRLGLVVDLEDAAKLRMFVKGKRVPATALKGRSVRQADRAMTPGDLVREYIHVLVKDVHLDADSIAWVNEMRRKGAEVRARQDAMIAAGVNRIPKDQQLKRGAPKKKKA